MFEIEESPREVKCQECYKPIQKKTLRVKTNLGSGYYPVYWHINCFVLRFENQINKLYNYKRSLKKLLKETT